MHARDRVVMLVDHEMVALRIAVPLVQRAELRDGKSRHVGITGPGYPREVFGEVGEMVVDLRFAGFDGGEGG